MGSSNNYSNDKDSMENINPDDKYSVTGESEFSRDITVPIDRDEVLSERHYNFDNPLIRGRQKTFEKISSQKEEPYRSLEPQTYRRSDHLILDDVSEALYRNSEVDASDIIVKVKNGIVQLQGFVESLEQKKVAEEAALNLAGVEKVYNELHIQPRDAKVPLGKRGLMDNITGMN